MMNFGTDFLQKYQNCIISAPSVSSPMDSLPTSSTSSSSSVNHDDQLPLKPSESSSSPIDDSNPYGILTKSQALYLNNLIFTLKKDWKKISRRFQSAYGIKLNPKTIKERYMENIEGTKHLRFRKEDDVRLISLIKDHGLNWVKLSEFFPGRCPVSLKNRYYSFIRKSQYIHPTARTEPEQTSPESTNQLDDNVLMKHVDKVELDHIPVWMQVFNQIKNSF